MAPKKLWHFFLTNSCQFTYLIILLPLLSSCLKQNTNVDEAFGGSSNDGIGTVGNSAISFTPGSYDFGAVSTFSSSDPVTVKLKNIYTEALYLQSFGNSDNEHYTTTNTNCPTGSRGFVPGQECKVTIVFHPESNGNIDYSMIVRYGGEAGSGDLSTAMSATGFGAGQLSFSGLKSITNPTSNTLQLNWNDASNEKAYNYFRISAGDMIYLGTVDADTTSVTVSGLSPSTSYTFRVRAIDYFGNSDTNTSLIGI